MRTEASATGSETASADLFRRSGRVIAGGVVSMNRKVEPALAFVRGQGSRIWDADGREYIDYHAAFAPHLLGHNDPEVNEAVARSIGEGWSLMGSGTTPWEARLAELLAESVPSLQKVQLLNTGSEAVALAVRLARAWTGREDVIVPLGGYNGWGDDVARAVMPPISEIGPRVSPGEYRFLPISAGLPRETARRVHVVNFNDADAVEYVLNRYPVACVLTEPVLQNIGVVPPRPGYLAALRALCDRAGALLVFDEVKTGFRSALGGYQSIAGVKPDLSVFGKAVANGYPLSVLGGHAEIMSLVESKEAARRVLVAGTCNAHPVPVAAAIATVERLRRGDVHPRLEALGARLQAGLEALARQRGLRAVVSRIGSAFCVYFADHVPADWHDLAASHDFELDRRYRRALIERGVYHFPLPTKQGSISAAHTEEEIDRTLAITREALKAV
jgi:glutamate-1-semialdehyde 2,1-aminomutase